MYNFSSIDVNISRVALRKFRNHLWYLTPEAVALVFFDKNISIASKRKMVINLNKKPDSNGKMKMLNLKEFLEFVKNEIEIFVSCETHLDFF